MPVVWRAKTRASLWARNEIYNMENELERNLDDMAEMRLDLETTARLEQRAQHLAAHQAANEAMAARNLPPEHQAIVQARRQQMTALMARVSQARVLLYHRNAELLARQQHVAFARASRNAIMQAHGGPAVMAHDPLDTFRGRAIQPENYLSDFGSYDDGAMMNVPGAAGVPQMQGAPAEIEVAVNDALRRRDEQWARMAPHPHGQPMM